MPLDMNTLTALKRSSLGLDLYLWLVYRTFPLRAPQRLTWRQIYRQFGVDLSKASDKETIKFFRRRALPRVEEDQAGLGRERRRRGSRWGPTCAAGALGQRVRIAAELRLGEGRLDKPPPGRMPALLTARNPGNPRPCTPVPVQSRG